MTDPLSMISALKRPAILIRAARFGLAEYHRPALLKRILGFGHPKSTGAIVLALLEIEAEMNSARKDNGAGYSAARHVEVMVALMGEAQLMRASRGHLIS